MVATWSCDLYHLHVYKLSFLLTKEAPQNLALIGQAVSERCLIIMVIYMFIAPGQGQTTPCGHISFINSIIQSV